MAAAKKTLTKDIPTFHQRFVRVGLVLAVGFFGACMSWGCAPKPEKRVFVPAQTIFDTKKTDTDLGLSTKVESSSISFEHLAWKGEMDASRFFSATERLFRLGETFNNPALIQVGEKWAVSFENSPGLATRVLFSESPYSSAAIGETREETLQYLDSLTVLIESDHQKVVEALERGRREFPWPKTYVSAEELIETADRFLKWWINGLEIEKIDEIILSEIRAGAEAEFKLQSVKINNHVQRIRRSQTLTQALLAVSGFISDVDVEVDSAARAGLTRAELIGADLDQMTTAQHALTVLIKFWRSVPTGEREGRFKSVSQELYDYLSGRDEDDLDCLAKSKCLNVVILFAKRVKIFPTLSKYGIDQLRSEMNVAAREFLLREMELRAIAFMPEIPGLIREKFEHEIRVGIAKITSVRDDYTHFIKEIADGWARRHLQTESGGLSGIEVAPVRLRLLPHQSFEIKAARNPQRAFETGAATLGSSMSLAARRLEKINTETAAQRPEAIRLSVAQLNKMLAIGGFKTSEGTSFQSYSIAMESAAPAFTHLNLRNFLAEPYSFAVPDRFQVGIDFKPIFASSGRKVSVEGQTELLRGLSGMIRYLRDWQVTSFDLSLGKVSLQDLMPGMPSSGTSQKFFPKDTLLAVAVANAAALLRNIESELTPVFLLDLKGQATWANGFKFSDGQSATMAAAVDIVDGKREEVARTADSARYILALCDFLSAIDGIEATGAPLLMAKDASGARPMDTLIEARSQLQYLVLGFANFLARQMLSPEGRIAHSWNWREGVATKGPGQLVDQALSVQALARAAKFLNVKAYATAAIEGYYFMNRTLWNHELRFYNRIEGKQSVPAVDEVLLVLDAVSEVQDFLDEDSRLQWKRISTPWMTAFESL